MTEYSFNYILTAKSHFFSSMSYSIFSTLYSVNPKICTLRAKAATHGAGLSHAGKKASLGLIYSLSRGPPVGAGSSLQKTSKPEARNSAGCSDVLVPDKDGAVTTGSQ